MAKLVIHNGKIGDKAAFAALCPFGALEIQGGSVEVNAACKMCGLCIKKGPQGAAELVETVRAEIDKTAWNGIAVYIDHTGGEVHPVSYELIGEALVLAGKARQPVYAVLAGEGLASQAQELLHYGVDAVYLYDNAALRHFRMEPYTAVLADFCGREKPSVLLLGATAVGRQLAPRVAARLRTGLTADCTVLDIKDGTELVQIRPAFGGNIMAEIVTPNHRPQLATVRYKVMDAAQRQAQPKGSVVPCSLPQAAKSCGVKVLKVLPKPQSVGIDTAEVLIVAGRGIRRREDMALLERLAACLGGQLACTRPVIEAGWMDAKRQVGLSGRTVRPKLIITCGVSGTIQFTAGMAGADVIVAIDKNPAAPIFKVAHYGLVGDLYEILPLLLEKLETKEAPRCAI